MSECLKQQQVSAAHVMVVGCGALGNEVLKNLVLLGVEHLVVVDFDVVEVGNLSRSVLFSKADADAHRLKVEVVAERVKAMNPTVEIQTICGDVAYDVGLSLIRRMDVVIGCVDRVFIPGKNCYACNLGPEGLRDLAKRMSCTGVIRRHEEAGSAPTTSLMASVIGAVQVQEAMKLVHQEALEQGTFTSLCGKMFYYDGQHLTTKLLDFQAYDDDCAVHTCWTPIRPLALSRQSSVSEVLRLIGQTSGAQSVSLCLENDCFVDYVTERANDRRTDVMRPGHAVEAFVEADDHLRGVPLSGLYQHEYREIGADFPYGELTLAQLGIPCHDVLHIVADGQDYYYELNEE